MKREKFFEILHTAYWKNDIIEKLMLEFPLEFARIGLRHVGKRERKNKRRNHE